MRDTTERSGGVDVGTLELAGINEKIIYLYSQLEYTSMDKTVSSYEREIHAKE